MLILTRNAGESIRIGEDIEVSIVEVRGGTVRVSIKAPKDVRIFREEVYERIAQANQVAAQVAADAARALAAVTVPAQATPEPGEAPDPVPAAAATP